MDQWREFETWQEKCGGWMKDVEGRLRDVDLRSSLSEKQAMLERLRVSAFLFHILSSTLSRLCFCRFYCELRVFHYSWAMCMFQ
jgi:hypothetical protein